MLEFAKGSVVEENEEHDTVLTVERVCKEKQNMNITIIGMKRFEF